MQNNNLQQMQSNAYNGGVMCSTMQKMQINILQKMQCVNYARFANCEQCSICNLSTIDTAAQYNAAVISI
jgi:hypothetical protein